MYGRNQHYLQKYLQQYYKAIILQLKINNF